MMKSKVVSRYTEEGQFNVLTVLLLEVLLLESQLRVE